MASGGVHSELSPKFCLQESGQDEGGVLFGIAKPEFTAEFGELAVKIVKTGMPIGVLTPEQIELPHLRTGNARLKILINWAWPFLLLDLAWGIGRMRPSSGA